MIAPETLAAALRVANDRARRSDPSAGSEERQPVASVGIQNRDPRDEVATPPGSTANVTDGSSKESPPPTDLAPQPGRVP